MFCSPEAWRSCSRISQASARSRRTGPVEFTGEITMISGQRCLVRGRVTEAGEFLEISADGLRSLVARDAELGEIFMRAFILRRLALIAKGLGNVIVMGSRHCANTLRIREFLGRNAHPYTYIDLDTDKTSQELLDRFEVKTGGSAGGHLQWPDRVAEPLNSATGGLPGVQREY